MPILVNLDGLGKMEDNSGYHSADII